MFVVSVRSLWAGVAGGAAPQSSLYSQQTKDPLSGTRPLYTYGVILFRMQPCCRQIYVNSCLVMKEGINLFQSIGCKYLIVTEVCSLWNVCKGRVLHKVYLVDKALCQWGYYFAVVSCVRTARTGLGVVRVLRYLLPVADLRIYRL